MRLKALKISVMRTTALAALLAATAAAGAANATIVFNLASPTGPLMPTETYTNAATGLYIVATGYNAQGHLTDLSAKNDSGDEHGLGLANDPTHEGEIHYGSGFVQLNFQDLVGKVKAGSTEFETGSTTGGEEWAVYGSNIAGSYKLSNLVSEGKSDATVAIQSLNKYKYYDFVEVTDPKNSGDNFLISEVTTTGLPPLPEPATWAMMLVGFGAIGATMRSARRNTVAA